MPSTIVTKETKNRRLDEIPVTALKGVGPKSAERLERVGIGSVQDVLFHLPLRYEDRTRLVSIGQLRPGDYAVIEGEVQGTEIRFGRRRSLLVHLADLSGNIAMRLFHFSRAQQEGLKPGVMLRCYGEVRNGPSSYEMVHPEYQRIGGGDAPGLETSLTPIYPTTEGMHQLTWRSVTGSALDLYRSQPSSLPEWLPVNLLRRYRFPALFEAINYLHRPPPDAALIDLEEGKHAAQQRLAFEELLAHQLSLRQLREHHRRIEAPKLVGKGGLSSQLLEQLPFLLTQAQQRVVGEIAGDMVRDYPMMRLVQGDVGSGKTVVATLAALQCIEAGFQVALMAPTELLAEQHYKNLEQWLAPLRVSVGWLAGRHKGKARATFLASLSAGDIQIVIGTHALFQSDVEFQSLGLAIIDEQHRFGVHQRLALREKGAGQGTTPHQLIMTATPIPRTLAMTAYADLDLSVIDELPPGRKPISTVVVADSRRDQVIDRVRAACEEGRQAYWVCTLIEESEALQCQAAEDTAGQLNEMLPKLSVGLIHGRMKSSDKEQIMAEFKMGDIDLLVATTVIEVGVDVPNASLMIIENPERLGLAQLHQLRGRVGRGAVESHCVLMYKPPLSNNASQRLQVMRETNDGFVIAQKDLELRGPGEVLGTRQTGEMQFRIADVLRDQAILPAVHDAAEYVLEENAESVEPLITRWIGHKRAYIDA